MIYALLRTIGIVDFQAESLLAQVIADGTQAVAGPFRYQSRWFLIADKAIEILRKCFIENIASSKANEVSFGQQKLLNLACCLASGASILLLDEPVAGVNPVFRSELSTIIKGLKEQGKSVLIIEHNADFIEEVADEILFLHQGKIQRFGSYQEFRNAPEVIDAYV